MDDAMHMGEDNNELNGRSMNPVNLLVVDDDMVSVMAIKRTLKKLRIVNPVHVATDGREALDFLQDCVTEDGRLPPFLVTLDLNMPRMNGHEFLETVRDDPVLNRIVIFVLTTSDMPGDVIQAYEKNVAGYIVKDDLGNSFLKAFEMLEAYCRIVELPQ